MDILFYHGTIVTMDEAMHLYTDGFLGVTDGKISYLGKTPPPESEKPARLIDASGMVLIPGLINCHTHLPMTLLRGYADDYALDTWLNQYIFPREARLDARSVKAGALLGICECLQFGVTSVSDMYLFTDAVADAVAQAGIKANLGVSMAMGPEDIDNAEGFDPQRFSPFLELQQMREKWHGYDNGRIQIDACLHSVYTSTYPLWDAVSEYAISEGLRMQLHLSETQKEQDECLARYGLSPAEVLDCHHVFDVPTTAAHCVHLSESDRRLLAKRGVTAVHCPVSNLKLASGQADVLSMVKSGLNVALGTDSAASNNNLDLFEEMKAACLVAKGRTADPTAMAPEAALMMATVCGAKAQGRQRECGMLKLGMDADLAMLDFSAPHLMPCHNVVSSLVYAASGRDVRLTMVRGKILYIDGQFPTIELGAVVKELADHAISTVFSNTPPEKG